MRFFQEQHRREYPTGYVPFVFPDAVQSSENIDYIVLPFFIQDSAMFQFFAESTDSKRRGAGPHEQLLRRVLEFGIHHMA